MTEAVQNLKDLVDSSPRSIVFSAGPASPRVSIPDFRSTDGLYHQQWRYPPEVILSHTFYNNPAEFFPFLPGQAPRPRRQAQRRPQKACPVGSRRESWRPSSPRTSTRPPPGRGKQACPGAPRRRPPPTTANGAGNFTVWTTSSIPNGIPGAAAAAPSKPDVVLYEAQSHPGRVRPTLSRRRTCSSSAAPPERLARSGGSSNYYQGTPYWCSSTSPRPRDLSADLVITGPIAATLEQL